MSIIKVENFSFHYLTQNPETPALRDITLEVSEGECLAVLGPTGAGKSTLCLAMNGIVPQVLGGTTKGRVLVGGLDTQTEEVATLAQVVGLMFQDPESQLVGMTVEEELFFGAGNYGIPREEIQERIRWALNLLRLHGLERREPATLSGGEKQRVALAAILVMEPQILVLDEPTAELDPIGRSEVYAALQTLKKQVGITILITSHDSEELPNLADRVILMNEGRIVLQGSPEEVFQETKMLIRLGVRPPQVAQFWMGLKKDELATLGPVPISLDRAVEGFRQLIGNCVQIVPDTNSQATPERNGRLVTESTDPIIRVKDLWYRYPAGTLALQGINLDIWPGDYVAIIGQNGSGKTTLVKHFNGLLKPTKGSVLVAGRDTRETGTATLSHRIGYCFQNPDHQIFRPTVRDEVAFGPQNLGFEPERLEKSVKQALEMVGLEGLEGVYPFNMGKGQRQKLALASVIAMQPEVLVVDEPTTGLDWKTGAEVMKLVQMLNQTGHTIIVITHDMELVAQYVPRTVVLQNGNLLMDGPTRYVLSQTDELKKTYLEPPQITLFAQSLKEQGFPPNILTVEMALRVVRKKME
jgi:energy-coupling factor transporter ATP-binding protein EcfA2